MKMIKLIHPRTQETQNINIQRFDGTPNELARQACERLGWDLENPQLQRTDNHLVCNELSDMEGCDEFEIAELAGAV